MEQWKYLQLHLMAWCDTHFTNSSWWKRFCSVYGCSSGSILHDIRFLHSKTAHIKTWGHSNKNIPRWLWCLKCYSIHFFFFFLILEREARVYFWRDEEGVLPISPVFPLTDYTVVSFFQGPVRIFPVLSEEYRSPSCSPPFRIPFWLGGFWG